MIKDFYFLFGLYPNLAKSYQKLSSLLLHLPMDDSHFGYKQNFFKKKHQSVELGRLPDNSTAKRVIYLYIPMCWKFESPGEIKSGEKANMISMLNGECSMSEEGCLMTLGSRSGPWFYPLGSCNGHTLRNSSGFYFIL
jgi:hypothetical protein